MGQLHVLLVAVLIRAEDHADLGRQVMSAGQRKDIFFGMNNSTV
jgi:hypothetical protein